MASVPTVPSTTTPPPAFPQNVTKTITFIVESQADLDYLNSEDEFLTDLLNFSQDIGVELHSIDGIRV